MAITSLLIKCMFILQYKNSLVKSNNELPFTRFICYIFVSSVRDHWVSLFLRF